MLPCFVLVPHGESLINHAENSLWLVNKSANAVESILADAYVRIIKLKNAS